MGVKRNYVEKKSKKTKANIKNRKCGKAEKKQTVYEQHPFSTSFQISFSFLSLSLLYFVFYSAEPFVFLLLFSLYNQRTSEKKQ